MTYSISSHQLTSFAPNGPTSRPHVVILGAGASLAAFPNGDANGKRLPLMANLVDVLDLKLLIQVAGLDPTGNFESLYSNLHSVDSQSPLLARIEQRVTEYFSDLSLPRHPTLYDLLLLSLRGKDAVFTFNWDPFLVDAYERNHGKAQLPHIFHLHGNVRVAFCRECGLAMSLQSQCFGCDAPLVPSRLLYPVKTKNYASDPFISTQWVQVRDFIERAAIITIFGYSAPTTDQEAMAIFSEAWKVADPETKPVERVEIIDIRDREELATQWCPFAHFVDHSDFPRSFCDSRLAHYPRRSCEALAHSGFDGEYVESNPWIGNLQGMWDSLTELIAAEG